MMNFKHFITCIDTHTGGEPTRIITSGFPPIPGDTILEKRDYVNKHYNGLRKMLMLEPRGHSGMYGCILVKPVTEDGDIGVLFTHNEGLSSMCGHATIGVTKTALETGIINMHEGENIVKIDAPCGRVTAYADVKDSKVERVRFQNVPCFVYKRDVPVNVDGVGEVTCDIVYCGAFYAYIDAAKLGMNVEVEQTEALVKVGMEIKNKVWAANKLCHPTEPGIDWLYGTILMNSVERDSENHITTKNICIFADGQIDRSPTGSGTGGRCALSIAKGEMTDNDVMRNYSIIDTPMDVKVISHTKVGDFDAVITEVSGVSQITGFNNIVLDPEDPLAEGFRICGN